MPNQLEKEIEVSPSSSILRWLNRMLISFSLLLLVFIGACYYQQFDWSAAVTVYPSWVWAFLGIALLFIPFYKQRKPVSFLILCLWLCYFVLFADTPFALVRAVSNHHWYETSFTPQQGKGIRVISLNCSSNTKPVLTLKKYNADIILVQESFGAKRLEFVTQQLYGEEGSFVAGIDASIIVRGKIVLLKKESNFVVAKAKLKNGVEVGIISLRLTTPPMRSDLWNSDCWEVYKTNRIKQRQELQEVIQELKTFSASMPIIIGGDFNAPPRSGVFQAFPVGYQDAFRIAGSGWGNSITNDFPFLRIDQLWGNQFLKPLHVSSVVTTETDHRLVMGDFLLVRENQ